ncbi:MAG: hypothetical protein K2K56_15290 [Lachnospiraceae bacterium]|nr:hypothetical protein [Lachnospiraceae bacterium]
MIRINRLTKTALTISIIISTMASYITTMAAEPVLVIDENISPQVTMAASDACDIIPTEIKDAIKAHNTTIRVTTRDPAITNVGGKTFLYAESDSNGYDVWNGQAEILINGSMSNEDTTLSLLHEVGHWTDAYVGELNNNPGTAVDIISDASSSTAAFKDIFNAEKGDSGLVSYFKENANEYYAECFCLYFVSPKTLITRMPRTYSYIQNDVNLACQ